MHVIGNSLMNFRKYIHVTTIQIKKQNVTSTPKAPPGSLPGTNPAPRTKCNTAVTSNSKDYFGPFLYLR